jgi:hypothetical protein
VYLCLYIYIYIYIYSFKFVCVEVEFIAREDNERESVVYDEDSNVGEEGEGGFRGRYQETEDYTPTSTYPSDVGDELPWEGYTEAMTPERCSGVKSKMQNDLRCLDLLRESMQSLVMQEHKLMKMKSPMTSPKLREFKET